VKLRSITAKAVAEAAQEIFSGMEVHLQILTDRVPHPNSYTPLRNYFSPEKPSDQTSGTVYQLSVWKIL